VSQGCMIVALQGCIIVALQGCVIVVLQDCVSPSNWTKDGPPPQQSDH
jgi:hypothetical protein